MIRDVGPRVLVCGGRNYGVAINSADSDRAHQERVRLFDFLDAHVPLNATIIHGGAKGADYLAGFWAMAHEVNTLVFKPQWRLHGKRAGPIRNSLMLKEGRPHFVIAAPGGKGTADMIHKSKRAGLTVYEIPDIDDKNIDEFMSDA